MNIILTKAYMKFSDYFKGFSLVTIIIVMGVLIAPQALSKAKKLTLSSKAFINRAEIPEKYGYTEDKELYPNRLNVSIPLEWDLREDLIPKVKSFAILMIDLHPKAKKFVHVMAVNLPWDTRSLEEGQLTAPEMPPGETVTLNNSYGFQGYGGPNPPQNQGYHKYKITLYALKVEKIEFENSSPTLSAFNKMLKGKIVAKATLNGKFITMAPKTEEKAEVACDGLMSSEIGSATIEMTANGFQPSTLKIKRCGEVLFVNKDSVSHWPASAVHPTHSAYPIGGGCIGSIFDACDGIIPGGSFGFIFEEKGSWGYHDHMNPSMRGTVVVE